jgi:hypothetical protein
VRTRFSGSGVRTCVASYGTPADVRHDESGRHALRVLCSDVGVAWWPLNGCSGCFWRCAGLYRGRIIHSLRRKAASRSRYRSYLPCVLLVGGRYARQYPYYSACGSGDWARGLLQYLLDGQARKTFLWFFGRRDLRCRSQALLPVFLRRSRACSRVRLARASVCVSIHLVEVAALVSNPREPTGRVMRVRSLAPSSARRGFVGAAAGVVERGPVA